MCAFASTSILPPWGALMLEANLPGPVNTRARRCLSALDTPILAPLEEREILYPLLLGDQTSKLRQIALGESKLQQVNRAKLSKADK
jgi:hypothetical protein